MRGPGRSLAAFSAALKHVTPHAFTGPLFRFIGTRFIDSPLSSAGSRKRGGRFNPPDSFEALYTALSAETAMAERDGLLLSAPGVRLATQIGTGVLLRLECRLSAVLDLTDDAVRTKLDASLAVLLAPWLPWSAHAAEDAVDTDSHVAPTQRLGLAVFNSHRFEAIRAPSAKDAIGSCLVIFPERLRSRSRIAVDDPRGRIRASLGLSAPEC